MDYLKLQGMKLGRYELQKRLSRQGSLVVTYEAYQLTLNRRVAVQILGAELHQDEKMRLGFIRAAEMMAVLEHPNIVPVHDCDSQDELTYIVTRFMGGGSLGVRVKQGIIPPQETVSIIRQIATALEYVHSKGIIHGDPSVTNIVFDDGGNAYISNFHAAGMTQNSGGELIGTPVYSAPEKLLTGQLSPETDQYALAAISYHMLTGQYPYEINDVVNSLSEDKKLSLTAPQKYVSDLPTALNNVLQRALAKAPEDRYPTVMDFAREFEKAISARPQHLFISYSRRDKDYAQSLTEHLQHNGFTVWIDSQIEYGDTWFKDIEDAIKTSAAFLLIMSPDSYESEWVQKEILLAKRYKKPIFPLLLKGEEFGIVIDIQFADVRATQMPETDFHRRLRRTVFGDV